MLCFWVCYGTQGILILKTHTELEFVLMFRISYEFAGMKFHNGSKCYEDSRKIKNLKPGFQNSTKNTRTY